MVRAIGEIQDILTDKSVDDIYIEGANNFEEWTVFEDGTVTLDNGTVIENDITILEDVEALWQGIVGCLHTPLGYIDGVTLEKYGSKLLSLRGMNLTYEIMKLAEVYIRDTIPQYQGYVIDFPKIKVTAPRDSPHPRYTMKIYIEVDSVFGSFSRTTYI